MIKNYKGFRRLAGLFCMILILGLSHNSLLADEYKDTLQAYQKEQEPTSL